MSEVEATLTRINGHKGVLGTIIVDANGTPIRTTADQAVTQQYAELIPQLASMARSLVRDLDPQNDLQFLRIRSKLHETSCPPYMVYAFNPRPTQIMVAPDAEFVLIVIQDPGAAQE